MDLHQVDPAAVPVHRAGQLHRAHIRGRGPDLVGDDHLIGAAIQGGGEQPPSAQSDHRHADPAPALWGSRTRPPSPDLGF